MFIAYIYDLSNTLIAQVDEVLDFETTKKINDVSTASFALFHTNPYCTRAYMKEYRRIKINMLVGNTEKTMFDGVIRGFEANLVKTTIRCESFEHYFDRRLLSGDYSFVNQSINTIIQGLLTNLNGAYNSGITLDCGITTLTSKEYKRGESFLKVLKDLAENGYEFSIIDKVLIFKTTIGIDRTTGDNFVEYRYDINEPDDRSIDNVKMTVDGKDLANAVLGKADTAYNFVSDAPSIAEFGMLEASFSTSWDDTATSQSYLDDHKVSLSEFDVDTNNQDFFQADLGDIVSVYIYVGNDVMFFDGSMKVIEKSFASGDLARINFKLWVSVVRSKDIIEQIWDVQNRLKTLELK